MRDGSIPDMTLCLRGASEDNPIPIRVYFPVIEIQLCFKPDDVIP
jgi:hypothetical protein